MTQAEAKALVARLMIAFPRQRMEAENVEIYTEFIAKLRDPQLGFAAVDNVIHQSEFFPSIAAIRREYLALKERQPTRQPALEQPPMSPEQIAENRRNVQQLIRRLASADGASKATE